MPIHGSAVFNVGARFSAFSLPFAVTGSCSRPVYPASPSHYVQTAVRLAAFVTGNVLFGQASFPDVQREFSATATFHRRAGAPSWPFRHRLRNNAPLTRSHCFLSLRNSDYLAPGISFRGKKTCPKVSLRSPMLGKTRRGHVKNVGTVISRSVEIFYDRW